MEGSNLVGTGKFENGAGRIRRIDSIVDQICQSEIFQGTARERIRELVERWFNTGHWWEPSPEELLRFLEGEL